MQILVLLTDLFDSVGGIQSFNRCLVKGLGDLCKSHNVQIKVLVLNDTGNSIPNKEIISSNISYRYFSKNRLSFSGQVLVETSRSNKVILGHVNFSSLVMLMSVLNPTMKKYLIVYGIDVWKKINPIQLFGINKITKIFSISAYTKGEMKRFNNIREDKFVTFPCTLDPFYPANISGNKKIVLPKGKIILSAARLDSTERYKNIDLVIKAMPEILKRIPDAYYVIVGEGSDRFRLELLAKKVGVRDNIIFAGYVSDKVLPFYYEACDVFVLPSEKEGFGIVFLEAMYFAKPCIGANKGGIPEVIEDNITGFLIKPNDQISLAETVIKLLKDDNLRSSMGKAGKERLEKEFSFERFRDRLEKILCH